MDLRSVIETLSLGEPNTPSYTIYRQFIQYLFSIKRQSNSSVAYRTDIKRYIQDNAEELNQLSEEHQQRLLVLLRSEFKT